MQKKLIVLFLHKTHFAVVVLSNNTIQTASGNLIKWNTLIFYNHKASKYEN